MFSFSQEIIFFTLFALNVILYFKNISLKERVDRFEEENDELKKIIQAFKASEDAIKDVNFSSMPGVINLVREKKL